jgi:hypothetical protein
VHSTSAIASASTTASGTRRAPTTVQHVTLSSVSHANRVAPLHWLALATQTERDSDEDFKSDEVQAQLYDQKIRFAMQPKHNWVNFPSLRDRYGVGQLDIWHYRMLCQ